MYAQTTVIRVPLGCMDQMRELIETRYLPVLETRPGFMGAYFLEQIDDAEAAHLVVFWRDQASVENFSRTGALEASVRGLAAHLPGVRVQRQGYAVTVKSGAGAPAMAYQYGR
ncbi:MAG: hypothetical protein GYB67_15495 [Chloroflexi bacterium]|nr:hypothetical protein [Chloroflexota bacterium]